MNAKQNIGPTAGTPAAEEEFTVRLPMKDVRFLSLLEDFLADEDLRSREDGKAGIDYNKTIISNSANILYPLAQFP